ncbi:HNH endonuclease [Paraburkholderia caffeinilytica]|uniref:HNH endonuclease n=1 Tax=Paraburkholderia caffeinilytica TaxID=1761016 RepID=UPI003DA1337E
MSTQLTAPRLRELLSYNPDNGVFINRVTRSGKAVANRIAGSLDAGGYVQIHICGRNYKAHRLAFLYMTGGWPSGPVDHRDGKTSNNRWKNLRDATPSINSQNQRSARSDNTTGLLGVSYDVSRGRYLAQISAGGKKLNLGRYATSADAYVVYLAAKRRLHEGNTL